MSRNQELDVSPTTGATASQLRGPGIAAVLAGASGRPLHLDGVLRPVIALGEGRLRGRALAFAVRERLAEGRMSPVNPATLNTVDLERIDLAAAEAAFAALAPSPEADRPPLIFLPLSWSTARNPRARRKLLQLAARAQLRLRCIALCEITGIERGAPASALREAIGALQPIFRGVLAQTGADKRVLRGLTDCGFTGASIEARQLGEDDEAVLRTVLAAQKIGPSLLAHAVRSVAGLTAMRTAGATWASLDIVPGAPDAEALAAQTKAAAG